MKHVMIALVRFYQKAISPLKPKSCRFTPSCSAYAIEAFEKRGFFTGFILTVWRILRCNPFCKGGYDPVPERGFRRVKTDITKQDGVHIEENTVSASDADDVGGRSPVDTSMVMDECDSLTDQRSCIRHTDGATSNEDSSDTIEATNAADCPHDQVTEKD